MHALHAPAAPAVTTVPAGAVAARRPAEPATALLCLHCSGSSGRQWRPIAAALAGRYDVACPDLLGYAGAQPWPAGASTSLDDEADCMEPLLDPSGVHLVGHSYGGAVALQLALRWPERVRSLTLYEPVRFALLATSAVTAAAHAEIRRLADRVAGDVRRGAPAAAGETFVDYWSGRGSWLAIDPVRQSTIAGRMAKVAAEFGALLDDATPRAAWRSLAMPVHLIGGSESPLPVRQLLDLIGERIPHAARTTLGGLGHMGPVEEPRRVGAAIDVMLRALEYAAA